MILRIAISLGCFCSALAMHATVVAQVPPPVLQEGQQKLAEIIIESLHKRNAEIYFSTLSENVQVYEDNRILANNKRRWLEIFTSSLRAPGLILDVKKISESSGKIMMLEHFNSKATYEAGRSEGCCEGYVAVVYEVNNEKIWRISRLTGGMIP